MPEEIIETRPQPKFCLLTQGEYIKLNKALSDLKGWQLNQPTERSVPMKPQLAKINIVVDEEGNETSYDLACVVRISTELQEQHPELITGLTLYSQGEVQVVDTDTTVPIEGEIESDVVDWAFAHCEKQGVDTTNLVTYIASQDATNYPPIPSEGEWCEAKIYAYNGNKAKCLQPHTRMHFTPEETPALWLIIETVGGYPEWVQPTGAHDAYQIGDKVSFNGNDYESLINANVWSPSVYPAGWKQI